MFTSVLHVLDFCRSYSHVTTWLCLETGDKKAVHFLIDGEAINAIKSHEWSELVFILCVRRWYIESAAKTAQAKRMDALQNMVYYYSNIINGVGLFVFIFSVKQPSENSLNSLAISF